MKGVSLYGLWQTVYDSVYEMSRIGKSVQGELEAGAGVVVIAKGMRFGGGW